ncbi:H-NS histone family protein [Rhodoferax sp.]|uniref:H-NS histone family protein n=1 Tax=Rhodoferax sp. TaxID=50421 RepID=UPI00262B7582|nr:H-NS histone family protein [Rhodoferax sp.]MDD2808771.1 H-NS histone family protein [Rhodoferax sp.]
MDELEELHQQIAELQKKALEVALKKKEPIIEDMKKKISLYGITAKELGFVEKVVTVSTPTEPHTKTPVAIKYRSGEFTWTGRGRQPKFIVDHLATGGKIEDLLV